MIQGTQSFSIDEIDINTLKDVDMVNYTRFLSENILALSQRINATVRKTLAQDEPVQGCAPDFFYDPDFKKTKGSSWYATIKRHVRERPTGNNGSVICWILPVSVYLSDCYNISCSQLILGKDTLTVPPLWLRQFLSCTEQLSSGELYRLFSILDEGTYTPCDTLYTLKQRIMELGTERGNFTNEFIKYPGVIVKDISRLREFMELSLAPYGNSYLKTKDFLGKREMLRLVIAMSIICQVSPDYLLLQDYSRHTVTPQGKPYSLASQQLMSQMLNIDAITRRKATAYAFACASQKPGICLTKDVIKDAASDLVPLNTFQYQMNAQDLVAAQQQIIRALKPRIIDIINAAQEPVSFSKFYSLVQGHTEYVRLALRELEREGEIESVFSRQQTHLWQKKTAAKNKSK